MSNHDLFLIMQETFLSPTGSQVHAPVKVDVHKAFDPPLHDALLGPFHGTGFFSYLYSYMSSFLRSRRAQFWLGDTLYPSITLTRCTPQGAVLSPNLFNLGMTPLARTLSTIPHLHSLLNTDDITFWCTHGYPGEVESTLQTGLDLIVQLLSRSGIQPAPEISEPLHLSHSQFQRSVNPPITIRLDKCPIACTPSCWVLIFPLPDRTYTESIQTSLNSCHQVTHVIRRVVRRHGGVGESRADQLITALALTIFFTLSLTVSYANTYETYTDRHYNTL